MAQEILQEQVKKLQSYIGGFAKLLQELQSRIKTLEEKKLGTSDEGVKEVIESIPGLKNPFLQILGLLRDWILKSKVL